MEGAILFTCATLFLIINGGLCENIFSASVQWIPIEKHKIQFTYHLTWRQTPIQGCPSPNTDPACNHYLNGSFPVISDTLQKWKADYGWVCDSGCNDRRMVANMSRLYYKNISEFMSIPWESAVETTEISIDDTSFSDEMIIRFYRPDGTPIGGIGAVHINTAVRHDTNRINIGPVVNELPFYSVPLEQTVQLTMHPYDGDGDKVRCKWGTNVTTSSIQLSEDSCKIMISTRKSGEFRIGQELKLPLYAEDYTCSPVQFGDKDGEPISGPFSRVPFLITVIIRPPLTTNQTNALYREDFLTNQNQVTMLRLPIKSFKTHFKFRGGDIRYFLSSGPRFMKFRANTNTNTVEAVWTVPSKSTMTGIHQACVMLYDHRGLPYPGTKCQLFFIGGNDECRRRPCTGQTVCKSWYNHRTCRTTSDDSNHCPIDVDELDFLKQYIQYMIYAGAGVLGLLLLMLLWCVCLHCCCGNKKQKSTRKRPVKVRERTRDSRDSEW